MDANYLESILVHVATAPSHYLRQCWPRSMSLYDVTGSQCVKICRRWWHSDTQWAIIPDSKFHGAKMDPPGSCRPQMGPCWPHEPCYQGCEGLITGKRLPYYWLFAWKIASHRWIHPPQMASNACPWYFVLVNLNYMLKIQSRWQWNDTMWCS